MQNNSKEITALYNLARNFMCYQSQKFRTMKVVQPISESSPELAAVSISFHFPLLQTSKPMHDSSFGIVLRVAQSAV